MNLKSFIPFFLASALSLGAVSGTAGPIIQNDPKAANEKALPQKPQKKALDEIILSTDVLLGVLRGHSQTKGFELRVVYHEFAHDRKGRPLASLPIEKQKGRVIDVDFLKRTVCSQAFSGHTLVGSKQCRSLDSFDDDDRKSIEESACFTAAMNGDRKFERAFCGPKFTI